MPELNACAACGNSEMWEPTEHAGNFCETWRCIQCKKPVPDGEELEVKRWQVYYSAVAGSVPSALRGLDLRP